MAVQTLTEGQQERILNHFLRGSSGQTLIDFVNSVLLDTHKAGYQQGWTDALKWSGQE